LSIAYGYTFLLQADKVRCGRYLYSGPGIFFAYGPQIISYAAPDSFNSRDIGMVFFWDSIAEDSQSFVKYSNSCCRGIFYALAMVIMKYGIGFMQAG